MSDIGLLYRARRRPPHRHVTPIRETLEGDGTVTRTYSCGHPFDEERAKRAKNNAKRGKKIQRKRIVGLGGTNLPGNFENLDGVGELFRYESKSTRRFPSTWWGYLKGIPHNSGEIQVLIVTEAPGVGHRARSMVIVDYDDWRALHEETKEL